MKIFFADTLKVIVSGNDVFVHLYVCPVLPVLIWSQAASTLHGHIISELL